MDLDVFTVRTQETPFTRMYDRLLERFATSARGPTYNLERMINHCSTQDILAHTQYFDRFIETIGSHLTGRIESVSHTYRAHPGWFDQNQRPVWHITHRSGYTYMRLAYSGAFTLRIANGHDRGPMIAFDAPVILTYQASRLHVTFDDPVPPSSRIGVHNGRLIPTKHAAWWYRDVPYGCPVYANYPKHWLRGIRWMTLKPSSLYEAWEADYADPDARAIGDSARFASVALRRLNRRLRLWPSCDTSRDGKILHSRHTERFLANWETHPYREYV